jgi:hypothetical protein
MSRRLVKEFKNYTCQMNQGFKVAFPNRLVVSVAFFDHTLSESYDESNTRIEPTKMPIFTFNQADLMVFHQDTEENFTEIFCKDYDNYNDYDNELGYVDSVQLADVMAKVAQYQI